MVLLKQTVNSKLKSAFITILRWLIDLNKLVSDIPYSVAVKNPYILIVKIVLGILSAFAEIAVISLVSVKEGVPTLMGYDPPWLRKLSVEESERRQANLRNRIKRESERIKIRWLSKWTPEYIDEYLGKIRGEMGAVGGSSP